MPECIIFDLSTKYEKLLQTFRVEKQITSEIRSLRTEVLGSAIITYHINVKSMGISCWEKGP